VKMGFRLKLCGHHRNALHPCVAVVAKASIKQFVDTYRSVVIPLRHRENSVLCEYVDCGVASVVCVCVCVCVSDAVVSEATSLNLQQHSPVKCETEHVLSTDSSDAYDQQQQQQHEALDEARSVILASRVPPTIALVASQSLLSRDQNIFYQTQDAIAAAGRNVTPVKCTSCVIAVQLSYCLYNCVHWIVHTALSEALIYKLEKHSVEVHNSYRPLGHLTLTFDLIFIGGQGIVIGLSLCLVW